MKESKQAKREIILFVLTVLWNFMNENMRVDTIFDYTMAKICELIGKGFLMWLISGWILYKSKNKIAGTAIVATLGLALTLIPQYIDMLKWSMETSSLSLETQIEVVNYIFMDKFIGKYIWRTIFWPIYYIVIYYFRYFLDRKKGREAYDNSNGQ